MSRQSVVQLVVGHQGNRTAVAHHVPNPNERALTPALSQREREVGGSGDDGGDDDVAWLGSLQKSPVFHTKKRALRRQKM